MLELKLVQGGEDQGGGSEAGQDQPGLAPREGQGGAQEAQPGPPHRAVLNFGLKQSDFKCPTYISTAH